MNKLIIGNWKMNLTLAQSISLAKDYKKAFVKKGVNTIVAMPSEFALASVNNELKSSPSTSSGQVSVELGAQNCFWQENGAYTGEASANSLKTIGAKYILAGHSERREYLGESCRVVNLKLKAIMASGATAVLCVGEAGDKRKQKKHLAFVGGQLKRALDGIKLTKANLVIAYEPIWAIGTGLAATPANAEEMHNFIRKELVKKFGKFGASLPILYGGSVNELNAGNFLSLAEVGGLLVGGASLKAGVFKKIANIK